MATRNISQIPAPRVPLVDVQTNTVSREWFMWFNNIYTITGAGTGITAVINGGTGLDTIPTNGQLLIGNGTGYTLNTLGYGAGISVVNASGSITVANTGVLSNIAGTGISVSGATGNVTIANTGVLSWAGGSTGLTPATATTGVVTLAGTLVIANGGTNGSATPTAGAVSYGTGTAYGFTLAGTSGQVLTSAGTGTPTWTTLTTGTSILYGNGTGGFSNVTIGSGVSFAGGTLSATGSGGTVTSVSGTTGRITSTGGTTPVIDLASGIATAGTTGSSTLIPVVTIDTYGRVTTITTAANPQGTVTSVAALTLGTTGTDLSSTVANGTTTPFITLQVPTASATNRGALSAADWTTFNSKQPAGTYVTGVSVVSANGFAGTVTTGATSAITLTTTITGLLKGDGAAISAAVVNTDYLAPSAVVTKTADFTVASTDSWIINNKSGSTCTVTLPAAASWPGRSLTFQNYQTQMLVSASSNVVPQGGGSAGTAILLNVVGNWATMVSNGTNWIIMQAAANNCLLLE